MAGIIDLGELGGNLDTMVGIERLAWVCQRSTMGRLTDPAWTAVLTCFAIEQGGAAW
ncbi:hypothetical protein [Ferrimonas marina]|uniref:hypothetical protein n=1 Tax=Ferrimonas marina TaxID=299255 RepID=UPI0012E7517E|nr:hypothetical protein [Ferrimonas marina]